MTDKTKGIIALISAIIIGAIGIVAAVIAYKTNLMTAFEYVIKKGAIQSTTDKNKALYGGYIFYNNNRVAVLGPPEVKGTYNKELITWDYGPTKLISDVFK